MSQTLTSGLITQGEWSRANKCKKYLKVLTVADILLYDGRTIDTNILLGTVLIDRIMKLDVATQGQPKVSDWNIWRKLLNLALTGDQNQLCNPVGRWVENIKELYTNEWQWFYDKAGEELYKLEVGQ